MEIQHHCEAVVVHCIDFRFQKRLNEFLAEKFPEGYDRIAIAGGVKDLVANGKESAIWKNLEISSNLHGPKSIVCIQHEDCGAYGGSSAFGDFAAEQQLQKSELEKAEELLKQQFSQQIETYFFTMEEL
ncbi:MAG: hypothetical protein HYW95_01390 [Candidatus Wildermuthbacteria bacterium]|nr:hypothetical protein [Candidatus Wildermuthbacteria bacterium]